MATYEAILQNVTPGVVPTGRGLACTPVQIPPGETLGYCRVAFPDTKLAWIQSNWDVVEWNYQYQTNQQFIVYIDPESGAPVYLGVFQ